LPSRRLVLLLLLAAPLAAGGGVGAPAAVALVAVLLLAAVVDWRLSRDGRRLEVRRAVADKLSLGAWNPVALVIRNGTARDLRVEARDLVPPDFEVDPAQAPVVPGRLAQAIPAGAEATATYRVRPRHRGDHQFGDVYVRFDGPLGLIRRQRRLAGIARSVRVYPNLRQLRVYDLLARRGMRLETGTRPVRAPGATTEFERVREYLPDDEFRRINWKATARRGKPMINQYEAERSQNLIIMVDAGRLMAARADVPAADEAAGLTAEEVTSGISKLDHALNAGLLLAYVAAVRGDRAGLLAYSDRVQAFVPPARGRRAILRLVDAAYNLRPAPVEPDHGLAFQFLAGRNLRRSLVVLFTDLVDRESSAALVAHLRRAARHHQVVCVTLADPTVTRPAAAAPHDAQSLYEKMVAQRLLDERAAVLAALGHHGVVSVDTDADKLSPRLVSKYLELKQRGRI
jgi:uncharacterized protein (DUF58 family)